MSNSLDPDQARRFVGPDLGPNCLQRLSTEDTGCRETVMVTLMQMMCNVYQRLVGVKQGSVKRQTICFVFLSFMKHNKLLHEKPLVKFLIRSDTN